MQRTMGESPGKSRRAKCTGARCVGPKSLDRTTRLFVPYVDIIKGRGRIEVAKLPIWGLTCGYFRGPWISSGLKKKTRFYAGSLVSQGPWVHDVGRMRWRGRVPDGLPDRPPDAARNATQAGATFAGD